MAKIRNCGTQSRFFCTSCGKEGMPVQRKRGAEREAGHLKKLYCIYCKKVVNHAEVREIGGYTEEDFRQEYDLGRFVDGNKIPIKDLQGCSDKQCKYNINGKCWNSNLSYDCGHRIKESEVESDEIL